MKTKKQGDEFIGIKNDAREMPSLSLYRREGDFFHERHKLI